MKLRIKKATHCRRTGFFVYNPAGIPINYLPFKSLNFILQYFIPENFPKAQVKILKREETLEETATI